MFIKKFNLISRNTQFFIDQRYRSKIRVFKWNANPTGTPAVILIRSTIVGAGKQEIVVAPYPGQEVRETRLLVALYETLKHLPLLGRSCKNLDWLACELSVQLDLQFRFSNRLFWKDPDHALVIFFDLKVNQVKLDAHIQTGYWEKVCAFLSSTSEGREDVSVKIPRFAALKVNPGRKFEEVEEIEECLKMCPGMVAEGARGVKEAIGAMKVDLFGMEENETECSICLERICVGDRFATTLCSHRFHKTCIAKWVLRDRKETCPVCRSPT